MLLKLKKNEGFVMLVNLESKPNFLYLRSGLESKWYAKIGSKLRFWTYENKLLEWQQIFITIH